MTHRRWTEKSPSKEAHFPTPKYNFTIHLRELGDWVQTNPIPYADYIKIKDAAKFWAWRHDVRVTIRSAKVGDDQYIVTVRLVSLTRKRQDPTVYDVYQLLTHVNEDSSEGGSTEPTKA